MKVQFFVISFFSVLILLGSGCGDVRLARVPFQQVNVSSSGDFCTLSPENIKRYTKFLFVMDKSGSNGTTDPGANKRAGGIERFYEANKDEEFVHWGMIFFQDPGTRAAIGGAQDPIFVPGTEESMIRGALADLRSADNGGTPYGAALSLAETAVANDLDAHPDEDNLYMIFFVSDGVPTDGASNEQTLRNIVKGIVNLSPGHVFLSTGYYNAGSSDPSAVSRLRAMAEEGMGKFVDFRNTDDFDFNELIVGGPTKEPWQIKNMLVYNLNASICEDGGHDVDSDGDGLCDKDEVKYGFDPTKRFTFEGGFGDYFHWRKIKFQEQLPICTDRTDEDHDLLTACEEAYIFNQTPVSPSPDIVVPQRGDPLNPDTDLDGFLDGIEIFSFRDKSSAMNSRDVLTDYDSEGAAGTQIKQHKNPFLWDPNTPAYDGRLTPKEVRADTGQICYNYSQSTMTLYPTLAIGPEGNFPEQVHGEGENTVFVYFLQTMQREPLARGILMYSHQKLKAKTQGASDAHGNAAGLRIKDGVFKSYIVPKN